MNNALTPADLPTLRRLVAHYQARARHRGLIGAIICRALAATCERMIHVIDTHGEQRPEINYHEQDRRTGR
jgi:hypothetical protein